MHERVQLEEQFNRQIAAAKAEARAQMAETRQAEREEMVAQQEKVNNTSYKVHLRVTLFYFQSPV